MNRIRYYVAAALAIAAFASVASIASASPAVNGAVVVTRVFNDCPSSTVTPTNAYPASISVTDMNIDCLGFANRHVWDFSTDGGATAAAFANNDQFSFCATLVLDGTGGGEGGLSLQPWWAQYTDGQFMCNSRSGEIACFGGRLPFYSFTVNHGLTYVKGTPITLSIDYRPNGLSSASPATITYNITYNAISYTSGPLAFDSGNTAEDPPHGLWGCLTPAWVGGYAMFYLPSDPTVTYNDSVVWSNICYEQGPTAATPSSWGKVKAQYRQ